MSVTEIAGALEASSLAAALRGSRWAYPFVNAAHLLGVAMIVGAVIPMDLRLAGVWRRELALGDVLRLLRPMAAAGVALAVVAGSLLFLVQARDYAAVPLFWFKMALIAAAIANALVFGARVAALPPSGRRLVGLASLALWVAILVCGRLLGYL